MSERKFMSIGDLQTKEIKDESTGEFVPRYVEVDGEKVATYSVRVYIPDDVDEAGIGEPSIILKKDQFLDGRALSSQEVKNLPNFLREEDGSSKVHVKLSASVNRKQYPRKTK